MIFVALLALFVRRSRLLLALTHKLILVMMIGLLEPTEVTPTGRRLFDGKAVERIALIKRLNDSGYPLRAIRELFMEGRTDLKGDSGE